MNENDHVLKSACKIELENGFYDYKINDIPIFNYLKRFYRRSKLNQAKGDNSNYGRGNHISFWDHIKMLFRYNEYERKSLKQILWLYLSSKTYDNFVFAFMRKELVNGQFVDKFTDPLIDHSNIKHSYIIFERSFQGKHPTPRYHSEKIIYDDILWKIAKTRAFFFSPFFNLRHKKILDELMGKLDECYPDIYHTKQYTSYFIHFNYIYTKLYYRLLKKLKSKRLIAPSRADFLQLIPAAKLNNIEVIELQHGITYGESMTYSGYRDNMFTPDCFLSFGKLAPSNVYGIDEDKIQEIGWAFADFLKSQSFHESVGDDVLVISEPSVSSQMLKTAVELAEKNPLVTFYFRPHPNEILSQEQKDVINQTANIVLDNNSNSIMVTMMKFQYVVGENSTALYEALAMGKKVGNLYMNGLAPKFLQEDDDECFWAIHNDMDFKTFLKESKDSKPSRSIYSKFKPDMVNRIVT